MGRASFFRNAFQLSPETMAVDKQRWTRRRWWRWVVAVALAAWGGYAVLSTAMPGRPARAGAAAGGVSAVPVIASRARIGDISLSLTGLGTVTALNTVTVRTRVDGELVTVAFQEGQFVRAGDLLAQIDPRPFQVQLEQAEGQAAKDEAALKNAQLDLQRFQVLIEQDAVPRQQLDTQVATVKQFEATVKSDNAQIDSARLNLTYARITSPLTGYIGLRLVDPGNIVHATDQNGLAVITQRQPIAVVFTIAQDSLPAVLSQVRAGNQLAVEAYDRDLSARLASGTLSSVDSQIDPTTGTIRLKATFPNDNDALFPNQFVNARLIVNTVRHAVIVPAAAIQRGPQKTYVYVVNGNNTVEARDVAVSMTEGDESVIAKGLSGSEVVVTDGVERLQPGTRVAVRSPSPPGRGATQ